MSFLGVLTAFALVMTACGGDDSSDTTLPAEPTPDPIVLAGTRWVATAMFLGGAEAPFVPLAEPTVDFNGDGRSFGGSTGCNSFFGEYQSGGGTIGFGGIGMTEMACEPALMNQESEVIRIFEEASVFTIADGVLTIGELGGSALQFQDRAVVFPDAELTGTEWVADTIITGDAAATTVPGAEITLFIDAAASEARGSTGCNQYGAKVETSRTQMTFGQVDVTQMACEGDGIMEQEQFVLSVLRGELQVTIDGDRLTLLAPAGDGLSFRTGG